MSTSTLSIAALIAVGPAALAQDAGVPEGDGVTEELQGIREQMESIARANDALIWISIGVSAASIIAMGLITVYLIRRQLAHMDKDAELKRRPILSWTKFEDGRLYSKQEKDDASVLKIRLVNAGHIAALSITCATRSVQGDRKFPQGEGGFIGSLAPNAHTEIPVMMFEAGYEFEQDGIQRQVEAHIGYRTIEGQDLWLKLEITYLDGRLGIIESHGNAG